MARVTADSGRGQVGRESRLLSGARNIYEELRKVVWPTREELVKMTGVVVATVIVVALALGAIDYVFNAALLPLENIVPSAGGAPPVTPPGQGLPPPEMQARDMAISEGAEAEQQTEKAQWYVVHAYSGHEEKVRNNLLKRVESMDMHDKIFDVLVPTEEVIEIKEGQRRHVPKRIFPGYILVNMIMSDESWYVVRNTPGVTSFVGSGNRPIPLQEKEIKAIQKQIRAEAPKIRVEYKVGENVRVIDGPFSDFHGKVDEINPDKGKLKVLVNMFGRETPVELDLLQVERLR